MNSIEPVDGGSSWSDDAKLAFDDLVLEKSLFAVVSSVAVDEQFFPTINLGLELVETSEEKDVIVSREMVVKGMARKKTGGIAG